MRYLALYLDSQRRGATRQDSIHSFRTHAPLLQENKILVSYDGSNGTIVLTGRNLPSSTLFSGLNQTRQSGMEEAGQLVTEFFQSIQSIVQVHLPFTNDALLQSLLDTHCGDWDTTLPEGNLRVSWINTHENGLVVYGGKDRVWRTVEELKERFHLRLVPRSKQPIRTRYLGHVTGYSANQGPVFPDLVGSSTFFYSDWERVRIKLVNRATMSRAKGALRDAFRHTIQDKYLNRYTNRYLNSLSYTNRYLNSLSYTNKYTLDLHFNRESLQETVAAVFPDIPITLPPAGSQLRISDIQTDNPEVAEFIANYYGQFSETVIPFGVPVGSLHRKIYTPDALSRIFKVGKTYKYVELIGDGFYLVVQKKYMKSYTKRVRDLLPVLQSVTSVTLDKPTPCPIVDKIWSAFNASGRVVIEEVEGCWVVSGCQHDVIMVHLPFTNDALLQSLLDTHCGDWDTTLPEGNLRVSWINTHENGLVVYGGKDRVWRTVEELKERFHLRLVPRSKQPIRTRYLGHVTGYSANQGPVFPDLVGSSTFFYSDWERVRIKLVNRASMSRAKGALRDAFRHTIQDKYTQQAGINVRYIPNPPLSNPAPSLYLGRYLNRYTNRYLTSSTTNRYLTRYTNSLSYANKYTLDLHFNRESLQETVAAVFPDIPITLPPAGSQLRISDIQTDNPEVADFIANYYGQFSETVIPFGVPVGSLHRKVYTPDALSRIFKVGKTYKYVELIGDGFYLVVQKKYMKSYTKRVRDLLPVLQSVTSVTLDKPTPCPIVDKIWSTFNASGRVVIEEVEGCWVVSGCQHDVIMVSWMWRVCVREKVRLAAREDIKKRVPTSSQFLTLHCMLIDVQDSGALKRREDKHPIQIEGASPDDRKAKWFSHFQSLLGTEPPDEEDQDIPEVFPRADIYDGPFAEERVRDLLPVLQSVTSVTLDKPTPCPIVDKIWSTFNASGRVVIEEVEGCWVVSGCQHDVIMVSWMCKGLEGYRNAAVTSSLHDLDIHQLSDSKNQEILVPDWLITSHESTEASRQPIRTRYLCHVTGYQPIRDHCFLIRSVSALRIFALDRSYPDPMRSTGSTLDLPSRALDRQEPTKSGNTSSSLADNQSRDLNDFHPSNKPFPTPLEMAARQAGQLLCRTVRRLHLLPVIPQETFQKPTGT
eukprot:sb/3461294/